MYIHIRVSMSEVHAVRADFNGTFAVPGVLGNASAVHFDCRRIDVVGERRCPVRDTEDLPTVVLNLSARGHLTRLAALLKPVVELRAAVESNT